jgi:hypothetical protein
LGILNASVLLDGKESSVSKMKFAVMNQLVKTMRFVSTYSRTSSVHALQAQMESDARHHLSVALETHA